nr:uncharacterized protein LOC109151977 [Ipomoea batatas]
MAWNLPSVNTTRQASSSTLPHPIAAEPPVPNPNPANPITFDPKDNTSPYHLHANESPAVELTKEASAKKLDEPVMPTEHATNAGCDSENIQSSQRHSTEFDTLSEAPSQPPPIELRRSTRQRVAPSYLADYDCQNGAWIDELGIILGAIWDTHHH